MQSVVIVLSVRLTEYPGVNQCVRVEACQAALGGMGQTQHAHSTSWWLFSGVATSQSPIPTPTTENYKPQYLLPSF